jgi:hypothetical protein
MMMFGNRLKKETLEMLKVAILAAGLGIALTGCSTFVTSAEQVETVESVGIIRTIDRTNRRLEVLADGQILTLKVNDQVSNFDQLELNDRIKVAYQEAVAVEMALPGDDGQPQSLNVEATAADGEKPGYAEIELETFVVEFLAYDPRSKTATYRLQDGTVARAVVPRELRGFARSRTPGERVVVGTERAVAIMVEPVG